MTIVVEPTTRRKKMTIWVMIKKMTNPKMIHHNNLLLLVEAEQSMFNGYCNIFYVEDVKVMVRRKKAKKSRPSKLKELSNQEAANRAMTRILSKLPNRMMPWWM